MVYKPTTISGGPHPVPNTNWKLEELEDGSPLFTILHFWQIHPTICPPVEVLVEHHHRTVDQDSGSSKHHWGCPRWPRENQWKYIAWNHWRSKGQFLQVLGLSMDSKGNLHWKPSETMVSPAQKKGSSDKTSFEFWVFVRSCSISTHRIHVWYICQHLFFWWSMLPYLAYMDPSWGIGNRHGRLSCTMKNMGCVPHQLLLWK